MLDKGNNGIKLWGVFGTIALFYNSTGQKGNFFNFSVSKHAAFHSCEFPFIVKTTLFCYVYNRTFFFYPVVAERDCLAIAKSPYIVNLFYSFQSKDRIFLVSSVVFLTFSTLTSVSICISSIADKEN